MIGAGRVRDTDDGGRLRSSLGTTVAITAMFACFMGVLFTLGFWSDDGKVVASTPQSQASADGNHGRE